MCLLKSIGFSVACLWPNSFLLTRCSDVCASVKLRFSNQT